MSGAKRRCAALSALLLTVLLAGCRKEPQVYYAPEGTVQRPSAADRHDQLPTPEPLPQDDNSVVLPFVPFA